MTIDRDKAAAVGLNATQITETLSDGYRVQERTIALDGRPIVGFDQARIDAALGLRAN